MTASTSIIATVAGTGSQANGGTSGTGMGDNGPATSCAFAAYPGGLAVDSSGFLINNSKVLELIFFY